MIDHIYHDGSRGHQFEVGDKVICTKEEYSLHNTPMGYIGKVGTVERLCPYSKTSTHYTTFLCVRLDRGGFTKQLNCTFEPAPEQKARKEIIVKQE